MIYCKMYSNISSHPLIYLFGTAYGVYNEICSYDNFLRLLEDEPVKFCEIKQGCFDTYIFKSIKPNEYQHDFVILEEIKE